MRAPWLPVIGALLGGCAPAAAVPEHPSRWQPVPRRIAAAPPSVIAQQVAAPGRSSELDQAIVAALRAKDPKAATTPAGGEAEQSAAPIPALVREPSADAASEPGETSDPDARLPPESIQRIVRASSGRFRGCYQRALLRDQHARGEILTFFVIGADGLVQLVQEDRATLYDHETRQCVQRAFFELQFPKPPAGRPITVLYPMRFGQGSDGPHDMPSARRIAEPPPPGFAERMRSGIPVPPDPVVMPFEDAAPPEKSPCASGDPICPDL